MSTVAVLSGSALTMKFGGLTAISDIDFTLAAGEILGIMGPNGAGKSTLFNLISGIYRPTGGDIRLCSERLLGLPIHMIAQLGIARTFQSSRLFTDLSVLDNVIIGMHCHTRGGVLTALFRPSRARRELAQDAARAGEILESVSGELYAQRGKPAGELAQADRRRLEIARALASKPKILLLDEPSSGMDDRDTDALIRDVRRICHNNTELAIMVIEHDMRLMAELPNRVMVLDYGRKIADGQFSGITRMTHVQEAYLGRKVGND
ncbi:MAG: ABC transporter ATP-binding protein [Aestuariivirga sp.]|jgi:branched-chain amino acid transport system ATP-binding protein